MYQLKLIYKLLPFHTDFIHTPNKLLCLYIPYLMNLNLNELKCLLPINYVGMSRIKAINGKVSQTKQSKLCFTLLWHVTEII